MAEYSEEFRERNRNNRQQNRDLEKRIGFEYRSNPSVSHIPFTEFKRQWKEAQKLKQLKKHYSAFEPLPNETLQEFKERLHGITILIAVESIEEFNKRIGQVFLR